MNGWIKLTRFDKSEIDVRADAIMMFEPNELKKGSYVVLYGLPATLIVMETVEQLRALLNIRS